MKPSNYLAINIIGLALVIFSMAVIADYSEVSAGILMGIGLSMSAFSFFKLLVNSEGKVKKDNKA